MSAEHASDADDALDSDFGVPSTPLGRLKACGLLVEATVNRRESVFVPAELNLSDIEEDSATTEDDLTLTLS